MHIPSSARQQPHRIIAKIGRGAQVVRREQKRARVAVCPKPSEPFDREKLAFSGAGSVSPGGGRTSAKIYGTQNVSARGPGLREARDCLGLLCRLTSHFPNAVDVPITSPKTE